MELTRRDAAVALAAAGIGIGSGAVYTSDRWGDTRIDDDQPEEVRTLERMKSVAEVLYPAEVSTTDAFLETYVLGRHEDDEEYYRGMISSLEALDERTIDEYDKPIGNSRLASWIPSSNRLDLKQQNHVPRGTKSNGSDTMW